MFYQKDIFSSNSSVDLLSNSVLRTHPARPMTVLGDSVIGSAGLGWSGDIDRLGGGDTDDCCIALPLAFDTAEPNPTFKRNYQKCPEKFTDSVSV